MSKRGLELLGIAMAVAIVAGLASVRVAGQGSPKTAWGAPDLQGIWENTVVTPFERDKALGTRELLTAQELADKEKARLKQIEEDKGRDRRDASAERDVAGAYNAIWQGIPRTEIGKRTSVVIDPPDGRIPPVTPEASGRCSGVRACTPASHRHVQAKAPGVPRRSIRRNAVSAAQ
jgi:hypothetical protein